MASRSSPLSANPQIQTRREGENVSQAAVGCRRKIARVESRRSLSGDRCAGRGPRSRQARRRLRGFETAYKGKIAEQVAMPNGGEWLAEAIKSYEAIDDLAGRLASFAGLAHAGNTVDAAISKFYGDVSERITAASTHLLFFALELNRVDDDVIERALAVPALNYYRPWIEDLRKDKPYQLEIASSNCSMKSPSAATRRGTGSSIRPSRLAVQDRRQGIGHRADADAVCRIARRTSARPRHMRWRKPSRPTNAPSR